MLLLMCACVFVSCGFCGVLLYNCEACESEIVRVRRGERQRRSGDFELYFGQTRKVLW